jgi:predicted CXXCH cytochrome family protein
MSTRHVTSTIAASVVGGVFALAVWLLGTAMPVAADGGPHITGFNSGFDSLTADSCSGCHRTHTAQGPYLINAPSIEAMCLSCHGQTGQGATTNVEGGVQFAALNDGTGTGAVAGALRGGGFVDGRIDSAHSSRKSYPATWNGRDITTFSSLVGVLAAPAPATSAHMDLDGATGIVAKDTAWGNGAISSGAGPNVQVDCVSCHNPHGNARYRILKPIPTAEGSLTPPAGPVDVTDTALPTGTGAAGTRNYTIQWGRTLADVLGGTYNWQNPGTPDPLAGDYWRRWQPWDLVPAWEIIEPGPPPPGACEGDVPMYAGDCDAVELPAFRLQITAWCVQCHTRYFATASPPEASGDSIYMYRHQVGQTECTQCHVSHGSNAGMPGTFSGPMAYPDGSAATGYDTDPAPDVTTMEYFNSRLLKIDNRGTCQACHDPTGTIPYDGSVISH